MSTLGSDREEMYAEANRRGGSVMDADGNAVRYGDRLRIYQSVPEDAFQFWVRRPEKSAATG